MPDGQHQTHATAPAGRPVRRNALATECGVRDDAVRVAALLFGALCAFVKARRLRHNAVRLAALLFGALCAFFRARSVRHDAVRVAALLFGALRPFVRARRLRQNAARVGALRCAPLVAFGRARSLRDDALRVAALLCALAAAPGLADGPRRWALVVGENRGLVGEEPLRYADADARRLADALTQLGGIPAENTVVLATADAADVRAALQGLSARLAASGERQERLVVFVSSHAGDGALHLRGTSLPLPELVDFLKAAPVEVGVLVVDACRSGAVTRLKGLAPASDKPRVEAAALEGRVLISASGADEYAQESEELSGSYFTHHLVTGLRGAADASRDGRVTLDEAYRWAWARTVEATFASRGGVQRPAFKVDLRGQGELVLTEPGAAPARLTLEVQAAGRWLVVAAASGAVVAELEKPEGPATLALAPGAYRVRLRTERGFLERQVDVPATGGVTLRGDDLERASLVRVALKGRDTPLYVLSASGTVASPLASTLGAQPGIDLRLRFDQTWFAAVNQLSLGVLARDASSAAVGFRQTELELRGGAGFRLEWARLSVLFGVDLGALLVLQSSLPDGTSRTSLGALALAIVEGRVHLVGPLGAVVTLAGGGALVPKRLGPAVLLRASGSAGLALSF